MSETVPPIPPPLGTNTGNPTSPNRIDPIPVDITNNTTTTNKDRFLVYLDRLEPYLIEILENGPFVPMSPLSTSTNQLTKPQKQWSPEDRRLANQDKRLKSISISCLPYDIMKSVIKCTIAKAMWTDLVLAHEEPSETKDTKIAALRLKFNAFKALEGEKVNGTFTRLKCLLNDLENNGVSISKAEVNATFVNSLPRKWLSMNQTQRANNSIKNDTLAALYGKYNYEEGLIDQTYELETTRFSIQASSSKALISKSQLQDNDSDVEEDTRSNIEFLADLNAEFHDRALLANQKRYYKRSGRIGSAKKPIDKTKETCFACGKLGYFQKDCPSTKTSTPSYPSSNKSYIKPKFQSNSTPQHNQNVHNHQKDYKGKYKGLKAEIAILTKNIDSLSKGKSEKGLVAESFDWDEESVSFEDEGVTKVKAFMAIVEEEPSVGKNDARSGQWVEITMKKVQRLLSMTDGDDKENKPLRSHLRLALKSLPDLSLSVNIQEPLPHLPKLLGAEPNDSSKDDISLADLTLTPIVSNEIKKVSDKRITFSHPLQLSLNREVLNLPKANKESGLDLRIHPEQDVVKKTLCQTESSNPIMVPFSRMRICGSVAHETSDLYPKNLPPNTNWKSKDYLKRSVWYLDIGCSGYMTRVKQYMHRYSKELGPKVVFGDNSSVDTEGSIIVKRHGKTACDVFRRRSPNINYFNVFGCPVHIHNHRDHLGNFYVNADDGFFLGYSLVAKAFRVFNIRRQEMEETYHVTFSEDDEAISKSCTKGDEINFDENRSFPDDEFLVPRNKVSLCSGNDDYFPYVPAHDPFFTTNISIPDNVTPSNTPILQDLNSLDEQPEFTIADDHPVLNENDDSEPIKDLGIAEDLVSTIIEPVKKHIELVNILGEPQAGVTTRSKIRDFEASSAHECLYVNFLFEIEPKKLIEALKEEGWIIAMQEELHQFERNKQANPKESHLVVVKRIFRYLKGTPNLGLWYPKGPGFDLKAYSDSDYAGCNLDRKSISEGCQILGKKLLVGYDVLYDKVPIFYDNTSVIAISNNPVLHSRTKHIDIMYHFIKDHILKGDIELHFVPTDLQLADIFTKPLAEPSFTRLVAELGTLNIEKEISDKKKTLNDALT
ncbi:retrovirus-related pol polyprotein from transposon TNT 1-94 [Tanacetum coccineum]|uniref:Retrovirus-related pol polyprotein from transposon TNT 1-94 n=1 Tax=Tanacetum coccineum TaxID=301880 RepID=A0ABQ4YMN1_9ASTR